MNMWLKSSGTLQVAKDSIRLRVSDDFINYYKTFIDKHYKIFSNTPAHGAHISIFISKIHGSLDSEKMMFLKNFYKNKSISFEYDPNIKVGGKTKNFRNFYINVKSLTLETISKYLKNDQYKYLHLTISNTKGGTRPYIWFK